MPMPRDTVAAPRYTVSELIFGGDFACAENQSCTLAEVARVLAGRVEDLPQKELQEVARLADHDMEAASDLWCTATEQLRHPNALPH